jgi:glycosyltransferase involved in cell wall biosynthesis
MTVHWPTSCCIIIPCFNEQNRIAEVVSAVRTHLPVVFVIDDGSTDATAEIASAAGATVLRHSINLGKGAALRAGCANALSAGFLWVLTLDGDGQHASADIPRFLSYAENTDARLVVGNRMADLRAMPWLRRVVNKWMSRRLSDFSGIEVPDSQCGFRLINLHDWSRIEAATNHFEVESETVVGFARAGFKVGFVPVQTIYKAAQSKIHPLADTLRWLRWYWKTAISENGRQVGAFVTSSSLEARAATHNTTTLSNSSSQPNLPVPLTQIS